MDLSGSVWWSFTLYYVSSTAGYSLQLRISLTLWQYLKHIYLSPIAMFILGREESSKSYLFRPLFSVMHILVVSFLPVYALNFSTKQLDHVSGANILPAQRR